MGWATCESEQVGWALGCDLTAGNVLISLASSVALADDQVEVTSASYDPAADQIVAASDAPAPRR